jgi:hypothetical protein
MAIPLFSNELFYGIIGLIGVGIAIIIEMRKSRGLFERLSDLFRDSIQITVDEKTAMLYGYAHSFSLPQKANQNEINLIILRIKSDLNSIVRVKNRMTSDQWVEINKALLILIESMEKAGMDTIDIRAIKEALR